MSADLDRDVDDLLALVDALRGLLVCYRVGSHPSEALMKRLDKAKAAEVRIRARLDGDDCG